ncbi:MAG: T9SS type A sorting domain-containing protein [Bacteroidota bacterium]
MKQISFFLLLLLGGFVVSNAQESKENVPSKMNPLIKFWKNEKIIFKPEDMPRVIQEIAKAKKSNENVAKNVDVLLGTTDYKISTSQDAESELHAIMNPTDTNNILVSPIKQSRTNFLEPLLCPIYFTKDFGKTWNLSSFKNLPSKANAFVQGGGDPVLAADADGKLYLSWINIYATIDTDVMQVDSIFAALFWVYSTNGGTSWNRESNDCIFLDKASVKNGQTSGLSNFADKQWMAVDRSNSQYRNTVYTSATLLALTGNGESSIEVIKKPADAKTFSNERAVVANHVYGFDMLQFSCIEVDNTGKVHISYFGSAFGQNSLFYSNSTDGGTSFSPPQKVSDFVLIGAEMLPNADLNDSLPGVLTSRLYPCPQLAVDKSNKASSGNVYLVWSANGISSNLGNGTDIYFSKSTNNGTSWSFPVVLNSNVSGSKNEQFYPSITVNEDGVLIVFWYDRRQDQSGNINTDIYMIYSFDGGTTFTDNFKINTMSSDFSRIGAKNGGFGIGEYCSVVASKGYAMPFWADGRQNDGSVNVYSATVKIEKNPGISSVESITGINSGINLFEPTPNPAQNNFKIGFKLDKAENISLIINDLSGNLIEKIVSGKFEQGEYSFDIQTSKLSNGLYYCRLQTESGYSVKKVLINK